MTKEWVMVRVQRTTHRALQEVRASLMRAAESGQVSLDLDHCDRFSLDGVILSLIALRKRHAERRTRSRRNGGRTKGEKTDAKSVDRTESDRGVI